MNQPQPNVQDDLALLANKIAQSPMPPDLKQKAETMLVRLQKMTLGGNFSKEFEPVSEYINWITELPWGVFTSDNTDLKNAQTILDKHHYGLQPVKTRLLEYLAVLHLQIRNQASATSSQQVLKDPNLNTQTPNLNAQSPQPIAQASVSDAMKKLQGSASHAPILCFVGIQGVGKTSMAKSIATALGREFVRIALGGLGGVTELRGRSRGEVDAEPGQVVKALIRTKTMNPLILLDEVDKVSSETGLRADVMAALLEILDPEQNATFIDKYIDYPIDLSRCIFICTANNLGGISAALLDRLEIIRFGSYNDSDKVMIAKNYLLPKVREATGITEQQLSFDDAVWPLVIRPLGFDAGVRQLERTLTELARKVALQIVQGLSTGVKITPENFRQYIPEEIGIVS